VRGVNNALAKSGNEVMGDLPFSLRLRSGIVAQTTDDSGAGKVFQLI
jgi:hypothetical protein